MAGPRCWRAGKTGRPERWKRQKRGAELFQRYRHAEHITKELVAAFVDQIRVAADGSIQITFLFDDALNDLYAHCKSLCGEVA